MGCMVTTQGVQTELSSSCLNSKQGYMQLIFNQIKIRLHFRTSVSSTIFALQDVHASAAGKIPKFGILTKI